MNNTPGATISGYTLNLTANQYAAGFSVNSKAVGGPIRSVTIGNQTTSTTVNLYNGPSPAGQPLISIIPGNLLTVPLAGLTTVCLAFTTTGSFDGSVFAHFDPEALSASGFVLQAAITTVFTSPIQGTSASFSGNIACVSLTASSNVFAAGIYATSLQAYNEVYAPLVVANSQLQSNGTITALGAISSNAGLSGTTGTFSGLVTGQGFAAGSSEYYGTFCAVAGPLSATSVNTGGGALYCGPVYCGGISASAGATIYNISIGAFPQAGQSGFISDGTNAYVCTPGHVSHVNANNSAFVPCWASAFTVESDRRAKRNIRPSRYGLATVRALRARSFTRRADAVRSLGFIAQDVATIIPEAVSVSERGRLGIDYAAIIPVLATAISELAERLDALR